MRVPRQNDAQPFDHATMEQLMERYRCELIGYQRATAPGRPTLAESLREVTQARGVATVISEEITVEMTAQQGAAQGGEPREEPREEPRIEPRIEPAAQPSEAQSGAQAALQEERQDEPIPKEYLTPEIPLPEVEIPFVAAPPPAMERSFAPEAPPAMETPFVAEAVSSCERGVVLCAEEEKSRVLAESLLEISEARVLRPPCSCAEGAALQEQFAPTRHRSILPAELPGLPACGCHRPAELAPDPALDPTWPDYGPAIPAEAPATATMPGALPLPCCGHTEYEKGIGARGSFVPYDSQARYTTAPFLQSQGYPIPVIARFAADLPQGAADAARCRRSFSVRFLCKEGEAVLPGQHLPVTVGCDEGCLAACSATTRPSAATGLRSREQFWEFLIAHPQALHAALYLYSDLGTIGSYRSIDGYCPPMLWENAQGEKTLARCTWLSRQRPQTLTRFEAEELCGADPDAVARDFVEALQRNDPPRYELAVQLLTMGQPLPFDPYDPTIVWPQELAPLRRIGLLTLEQLVDAPEEALVPAAFFACASSGLQWPTPQGTAGFSQVGYRLQGMSEQERRRLLDNLCDELLRLPATLLEEVLILVSKADLGFGQALTTALGG